MKHKIFWVSFVVVCIALMAYAQSPQTFTRGLLINSSDNIVKIQVYSASQIQDWLNFSDGNREIFSISGKGGIGTTKTNTGIIFPTGFTNTSGDSVCYISGNSITYKCFDGQGNVFLTNTVTTGQVQTVDLQEGGSITAASGLLGNWHSF